MASVQILGKEEYVNNNDFAPDYFEYIVFKADRIANRLFAATGKGPEEGQG